MDTSTLGRPETVPFPLHSFLAGDDASRFGGSFTLGVDSLAVVAALG